MRDEVDRANGPLAQFRNARLRAAWMRIAEKSTALHLHPTKFSAI